MERVRKSGGGISRTTSDQTSDGGKILRVCLFVCLERALARIPTLRRPVEWHKPSYKELV